MQELINYLMAFDINPQVAKLAAEGHKWMSDSDVWPLLGEPGQKHLDKILKLTYDLLVTETGRGNYVHWLDVVHLAKKQGYYMDISMGEEDLAYITTPVCKIAFDCY